MFTIKELGSNAEELYDIYYEKMNKYDIFHTSKLHFTEWNHSYNKTEWMDDFYERMRNPEIKNVYLGAFDSNNKCVGFFEAIIHFNIYAIGSIVRANGLNENDYSNKGVACILGIVVDNEVKGSGVSDLIYNYFKNICYEFDCRLISTSIHKQNIASLSFHLKQGFNLSHIDLGSNVNNVFLFLY